MAVPLMNPVGQISLHADALFCLDLQKQPVTDSCDGDVTAFCLKGAGLDSYRVGAIRACLVNVAAPPSPPDFDKVRLPAQDVKLLDKKRRSAAVGLLLIIF